MAENWGSNVCVFFFVKVKFIYRYLVSRLLCVAGAGRGPLVARALKAISRANRQAFVHVVEKNPNAFVT